MTLPVVNRSLQERLALLEKMIGSSRGAVTAGLPIQYLPDGRPVFPSGVQIGGTGLRAASLPTTPTGLVLTPGFGDDGVYIDVDWQPGAVGSAGPVAEWAIEVLAEDETLPTVMRISVEEAPPCRIEDLLSDTEYTVTVRAIAQIDRSSSDPLTGTVTTGHDTTVPPKIVGLVAGGGIRSITAWWAPLGTIAKPFRGKYLVQVANDSAFTVNARTFDNGNSATAVISDLSGSTLYYVRVRAQSQSQVDGPWSDPTSVTTGIADISDIGTIFSNQVRDNVAPGSSPAPVITGGVGYLSMWWPAVTNADIVTYDVHLSAISGFTPDPTTLVASVTDTNTVIRNLPGSSAPLAYNTIYYVRIVARDIDGSAAASAQGSGQTFQATALDIHTNAIDSDYGHFNKIDIGGAYVQGTLDVNRLAADSIGASKLAVTIGGANRVRDGAFAGIDLSAYWTPSGNWVRRSGVGVAGLYGTTDAACLRTDTVSSWHTLTGSKFDVIGGQKLSIRFWYFLIDVRQSHVKVNYYNTVGAFISSDFALGGTDQDGSSGWVEANRQGATALTVPVNAVKAEVQVMAGWYRGAGSGSGQTYIRSIIAVLGDIVGPYVPAPDEILPGTIIANMIGANEIEAVHMKTGTITADSGVIASLNAGTITTGDFNATGLVRIMNLDLGDATVHGQLKADRIGAGSIGAYLIQLEPGGIIRSSNFVSGASGWQIDGAGNPELNSATIRGNIVGGTINIANKFIVDGSGNAKLVANMVFGLDYSGGMFVAQSDGSMQLDYGFSCDHPAGNVYHTKMRYDADGDSGLEQRSGVYSQSGLSYAGWVFFADQYGSCQARTSWGIFSSKEVKKSIKNLRSTDFDRLLDLKPVSYWLRKGDGGREHPRLGFIAEDVAPVIPEMVVPPSGDSPMALVYDHLFPLLVGKAQDHEQRIAELERKLVAAGPKAGR